MNVQKPIVKEVSIQCRPPSQPRVAFLARNMMIGGAERTYLTLVNHAQLVTPVPVLLRRAGGLLSQLSGSLDLNSLDAPTTFGRVTPELLERIPGGSPAQLLLEVRRLSALVSAKRIGVVTSFLMRSHLVALLAKVTCHPQLRVVLNIHEHMSESEAFLYPNRRDRVVARWVAQRLFPLADRIVVVSDELGRDLVTRYGIPVSLVQTLSNPVDLERIRSLATQPVAPLFADDDQRPTICAVGRLVHLKGIDLLLHAIAALRPTLPTRLVVVGDGVEREPLAALASQLGLDDAVRFVGWQQNPWCYMRNADVLALTSRTEAFPSVLTEAMAVGTPTVAVECTAGIRDCLDDGKAGLLVAPEDPSALAHALHRVLTEPTLASTLRTHGTTHVAQYALARRVGAYDEMLAEQAEAHWRNANPAPFYREPTE